MTTLHDWITNLTGEPQTDLERASLYAGEIITYVVLLDTCLEIFRYAARYFGKL